MTRQSRNFQVTEYIKEEACTNLLAALNSDQPLVKAAAAAARITRKQAKQVKEAIAIDFAKGKTRRIP